MRPFAQRTVIHQGSIDGWHAHGIRSVGMHAHAKPAWACHPAGMGRAKKARRAFTLVELVTAASLMTIMMIGVVQIFGIITRTAADAEGLSFAQQQARVLFDRLNRDLRGMTREGYLYIAHNAIGPLTTQDPYARLTVIPLPTDRAPPPSTAGTTVVSPENSYFCDTLAFVTIGQCSTLWNPSVVPMQTGTRRGWPGCAAEVEYTNMVFTPTEVLDATRASTSALKNPRKGLLARGQWTWYEGQIQYRGQENQDDCDNAASPATRTDGTACVADLLARQDGGRPFITDPTMGLYRYYLRVWPWKDTQSTTGLRSLRNVVASCVSEFYVETYRPAGDPVNAIASNWRMAPTSGTQTYRWSGRGTGLAGAVTSATTWPRAIRVTVAIHDPFDNKPLRTGPGAKRAEGYVFQETFLITDP